MPPWQLSLDAWFAAHLGVASHPELRRLGLCERTIERMVARGQLVREMPGVYRSAQWPNSHQSRMRAACARNDAALIAFTTACREWSIRGVKDNRLHVLVPHGASPEIDGIVIHRCRRIDAVDIVERPDGIRLTSPPRTLFDSADLLGLSGARSALEQLLHDRVCTLGTVCDTFARLRHPRRPGSSTMEAVLASRPKWRSALQSNLEQLVLEAIERAGLPTPVTQCPIELIGAPPIHADFGWPEWRVALEVDDPAWHDGAEESQRDAHRDRKAIAAGWAIPRVTRLDVEGRELRSALEDVRMILRARRWVA